MFRIVTDAAADMPVGWKEKYQIDVLPLNINFGEKTYDSNDFRDSDTFYRMVQESRIIPKTSLPSPMQIINFYRKIASTGDTILSIHVASKMSGTFATVQGAARELANEFKIFTLDSGAGSAALGFMCREARRLANMGWTPQQIIERIEAMKNKLTIIFTVNSLEFAYLSGRINRLQSAVSSLLNIKPIILLKDGLLQMADKVRTREKSLEKIIEAIQKRAGNALVDVAVVHANDLHTAQALIQKIRARINVNEIVLTELSLPVAANLGPGTIGIVAVPVFKEE